MIQSNENLYFSGAYSFSCSEVKDKISSGFNLIQLNARSLKSEDRLESLKLFLETLSVDLDIIVVSEVWLNEEEAKSIEIGGFNCEYCVRSGSGGGGLVILINNRHGFQRFDLIEDKPDSISVVSLKIHVNKNLNDFLLCHGIYRPGRTNFRDFLGIVEKILSNGSSRTILAGDMNVNVNKTDSFSNRYTNLLESYGFDLGNTLPTRDESQSIIDHFISNISDIKKLHSTISCDFSDHSAVLSSLYFSLRKDKHFLKRSTIVNYEKVQEDLMSLIEDGFGASNDSADDLYNEFTSVFQNSIHYNSREKIIKLKNNERILPYLNNSLIAKIKEKERILNAIKKARKLPQNCHTRCKIADLESHLSRISRELNNLKDSTKKDFFRERFAGSSVKEKWNQIFALMGGRKKKNVRPKLRMNGAEISTPSSVANEFNKYFSSVGETIAGRILKKPTDNINNFGTIPFQNKGFFLFPADPSEIEELILGLNNKKSPGPDGIKPITVKKCSTVLSRILSIIFNKSVESGVYPTGLKVSRVVPIFKKGDPSSVNNYRPISIYSIFNKIFEKLLYIRILRFLKKNKFFYMHQYGFRPGCSTATAAVEICSYIYGEIDRRNIVGGAFLDLEKCFDTIDHELLLDKLYRYGFRGISHKLFASFLSDRFQYVEIDEQKSEMKRIKTGIFQGSSLGPLLYLIFCNDLGALPVKGKINLFADDTGYFLTGKTVEEVMSGLQNDLALFFEYFRVNKLSVNASKTSIVLFRTSNRMVPDSVQITVNDIPLNTSNTTKYLGLILDEHLSWKFHIEEMCLKLSKVVGVLRKLSYIVPAHFLRTVYYSIFHSHITYCSLLWGSSCKTHLEGLQILQNRAIKNILHLPLLTDTIDLYKTAKIPSIKHIFYSQLGLFVSDVLNSRIYSNLSFSFSNATSRHRRLKRKFSRTMTGQRDVLFEGPRFYNILPTAITSSNNRTTFKRELNDWLSSHDNLVKILRNFCIY